MSEKELQRAASAIWRMESAKLVAVLASMVHDLDVAEDLAQEAFIEALARWQAIGIPQNPAGWLMIAGKHRALDYLRRKRMLARKHDELVHGAPTEVEPPPAEQMDEVVGDELLRLVFVACHPVLSREASVALTLRLLCGLSTDEIARAFLVPEPTIAQRITRAKRTLLEKQVPFELPAAADLEQRLEAVLSVIYLVFNEGYAATAGDDWVRPALCDEAMRLGRIVVELVPAESEVRGLLALLEIQASRTPARTGERGEQVLLEDQNRKKWDGELVQRGLAGLQRAMELVRDRPGPYLLQAAIAACHARARTSAETDWARIAALYDALAQIAPSPIVELNRAVAIARVLGPKVALEGIEPLRDEPALRESPLLPSVRADLLARLGRFDEARTECERALSLTRNTRERAKLRERAESYGRGEVG